MYTTQIITLKQFFMLKLKSQTTNKTFCGLVRLGYLLEFKKSQKLWFG